jgi:polyisoprenoid-binding protein YceI
MGDPMTTTAATAVSTPPRRRRRWLRWTLAGVAALIVLLVAAVAAAIKLQPESAPLALPSSVAAPTGPLDGPWQPSTGSLAGFRVQQTVIGLTSDVVGRTADVTGTVTLAGNQVTAANLRINLLALTSNGKQPAPQFGISLDTVHHPDATVILDQPIALDNAFATGGPTATTATGRLTLHGVTRTVSTTMTLRRDGPSIDITGTIPITFADWNIPTPKGYGAVGSLANHGTAEFLLILDHS